MKDYDDGRCCKVLIKPICFDARNVIATQVTQIGEEHVNNSMDDGRVVGLGSGQNELEIKTYGDIIPGITLSTDNIFRYRWKDCNATDNDNSYVLELSSNDDNQFKHMMNFVHSQFDRHKFVKDGRIKIEDCGERKAKISISYALKGVVPFFVFIDVDDFVKNR
jgi:hypothetical protein